MKESILTKEFAVNYRISVYYDDYAENPRKFGDMCSHFVLKPGWGDEDDVRGILEQLCERYGIDYEERPWLELIQELDAFIVIKPVCHYTHSGTTIFFGEPNDRWDSGYIGFAYMTEEDVNGAYCGRSSYYETWRDQAEAILDGDIEVLAVWISGETKYWEIEQLIQPTWQDRDSEEFDEDEWREDDEHWEYYESCGGYYYSSAEKLANEIIKEYEEHLTPKQIPFKSKQLFLEFA